jgi:hypothetical protein
MINANFSKEAWDSVQEMLYAENQAAQLEGTCGQKKKREAMGQPRTPAQEQADKQRAQQQRGRDTISSATRSEAARKAAETRKRCKGGASGPSSPQPPG